MVQPTPNSATVTLPPAAPIVIPADPNAPAVAPHASDAPPQTAVAVPASVGAPVNEAPGTAPPAPRAAPNHTAAYVAWGMGVVGVGVGSAFGLIAMKDKHDIVARCAKGTVILVGHSMGGSIAGYYAGLRASRRILDTVIGA